MRSCTAVLFLAALLVCAADAQAVVMNWSAVGNPGNANDPATGNLYGGVGYNYNIGTYDVTASQYAEFLNAKDPAGLDLLGLYQIYMSAFRLGGINFNSGNPNGTKYSVIAGHGNHPANAISWYDAIRFANWMNNGQGNGDTETGAYTLGTLGFATGIAIPVNPPLTHNAGARIWLPTENEWYKAAYYNHGTNSYFQYPTSSNTAPTAAGFQTALPNNANYNNVLASPTDVGFYSGTTSPYGAFDMGGNALQWNEAFINGYYRGQRGGSYFSNSSSLLSSTRDYSNPDLGFDSEIGFRLASVPEPSTGVLAVIAGGMLWWWRKRFK